MKEDVLKIEFVPVFDKWAWRIAYQNEEVLPRYNFEDDELEVYTENSTNPCYEAGELHLRSWEIADNDVMVCTTEEKAEIEAKVKAVNEKYGIVKRWRADNCKRYWKIMIDSRGCYPESIVDYKNEYDNNRYNNGNYFKTKEQCKNACDEINAIFEKNKQGGFQ